jgi:hypothetical protein
VGASFSGEVSRLLLRREAAVEVFKTAVEVSRPLSKC